jgi:UDP-glucuronate decarboxylase
LCCALQMQETLGGELSINAVVRTRMPPWLEQMRHRITVLVGDVTELKVLQSLPESDIIIHAATYGQPGLFTAQPQATLILNTTTTVALLNKLQPGGKFLFFSSSEVYSGLQHPPFREDQIGTTSPLHPRASYIEAKRCGEAICYTYRRDDVDVKCIRLCSTYGPGVRRGDQRVLYHFAEQGLRHGRIELLDLGSARRAYCYISDMGCMTWKILLGGKGAVYNVGGVWRTTIAELAQRIGGILGVPVCFPSDYASGLPGSPQDVQVDIAKFEDEFGPHTFLEPSEGLARTLEWCRLLFKE